MWRIYKSKRGTAMCKTELHVTFMSGNKGTDMWNSILTPWPEGEIIFQQCQVMSEPYQLWCFLDRASWYRIISL